MPDPTRAGPCTVVVAGQKLFVVDAGAGGTKNLSLMNLPPARVDGVFLTHFHSDHIDGLGELLLQRWAGGANTSPLPVWGPTGVDRVVGGFMSAYELDRGYRIAHHGPKVVPPSGFGGAPHPFAAPRDQPDVVLIDAPPILPVADSGIVANLAGMVFLVARHGVTSVSDLRESVRRFEQIGVGIRGVIFNDMTSRPSRYGSKYTAYGYPSYGSDTGEAATGS